MEAPSVDARLLPIIGSSASEDNYDYNEDDIATPMVEGNIRQFPNINNESIIANQIIPKNIKIDNKLTNKNDKNNNESKWSVTLNKNFNQNIINQEALNEVINKKIKENNKPLLNRPTSSSSNSSSNSSVSFF